MTKNSLNMESNEKTIYKWITVISILVPIAVAVLLFMPSKVNTQEDWVYFLPHLNAVINSFASVMLLLGLYFIKNGKIGWHKMSMSVAFGLGAIFLVSYIIYHSAAESASFGGEGWIRWVYYPLLITHIILAAVALFPILLAYYYGMTGKYDKHRSVVRYAFPIWLYVTVSGVIVYLMISPYYTH
ncbi:DUF420 domain-containing protein [Cyclobacterium qasimii]|uniref:Membrane protein n=2 Tax=Cyclobacterium qasimii TaxID=1350429 RepID=A0A512CCN7_9BACT|nr:DUF420 domain-containing protein [Cyclobacterium qasimii]GEO21965.1 membrane protein [Cyclobacterium qasimii]